MKLRYGDEIWHVLSGEECLALSVDELWDAIRSFDLTVCRRPGGSLTTAHIDDHDYEIIEEPGDYEVVDDVA